LADAARCALHSPGDRWFVDETYVKVNEVWRYVYSALDQQGRVIDILVSKRRNGDAAAARLTSFSTKTGATDESLTMVTYDARRRRNAAASPALLSGERCRKYRCCRRQLALGRCHALVDSRRTFPVALSRRVPMATRAASSRSASAMRCFAASIDHRWSA
jgi:transposase-like protein